MRAENFKLNKGESNIIYEVEETKISPSLHSTEVIVPHTASYQHCDCYLSALANTHNAVHWTYLCDVIGV